MSKGMLKEGSLKGKTIMVTGGGTGLGRAMTEYFMELGANVVITSRKLDVLEKTAQEMRDAYGTEVLPLACDVRKNEQVEEMVQKAIDHYGKIHGLVNNAAGNFISPTERLNVKAFEVVIGIVLMGSIHCTLALGKHWLKNKERDKSVLNIVTTYAWTGSAYVLPSACAKAGVLSLTRSLAVEWGKHGIRHNAIAPGPFPTKGAWSRLLPGDMFEQFDLTKKVPLGRLGENHELANLAAYLISDYSGYVNGEVMTIDGGEWLYGAGQFNMLDHVPAEMWDSIEQMVRSVKGS